MTTSGLATPPRAAPPRPQRIEPKPVPRVRTRSQGRRSFERVFAWSIAGSIVVHLLLLLLSPFFIQMETPPGGLTSAPADVPQAFGLEMIVAIPSETAPDVPLPQETPAARPQAISQPAATQPSQPTPTGPAQPTQPTTAPAAPSSQQRSRTATEALQPGERDPRLYVPPRPLPPMDERSEHERYMEHLQARIDAVNDSLGVEASRGRTTSDWTIRDGSGNRWGLSPDGLHLGGVTIPKELIPRPAPTGDNQQLEAERERQRQRDEIQRQGGDAERRERQNERIEATREQQNQRRENGGS